MSDYLDAAGRPTYEGYSIDVTAEEIVITGASSLGAWWATRSILQQGVLNDGMKLSLGKATDAPGWGIRGTFVSTYVALSGIQLLTRKSLTWDDITIHRTS
jgi:hexosaminidase